MRAIWVLLALSLVACGGSDGKDGKDGATGPAGPAGMNGKDGEDGAKGADGEDGAKGADGEDGANGEDGADGSAILKGTGAPPAELGADGDLYIDTASRDVYQKTEAGWAVITNLSGGPPGPKGDTGSTGSSVRTGAGTPAAGLGNDGDVYIDSTTGDLYSKAAGAWTKTGSLKGPAGADGADGADGVDVKDTLKGVRWFAFALNAAFVDATATLLTSETYTPTSSAAAFTFTGADQHGRLGFATAGSYLPGGVDLSAYEALSVSVAATGGTVKNFVVLLTEGEQKGCQWTLSAAGGPAYSVNLSSPATCYNDSSGPAFSLKSVTNVQIGMVSNASGGRTLTVSDIEFEDTL